MKIWRLTHWIDYEGDYAIAHYLNKPTAQELENIPLLTKTAIRNLLVSGKYCKAGDWQGVALDEIDVVEN